MEFRFVANQEFQLRAVEAVTDLFDGQTRTQACVQFTPDKLSKSHQSVQRNPIIADIFNRAGLIEKWGRGTNRVIAMCRKHGAASPTFEERSGFLIVTFRAPMVADRATAAARRPRSQIESQLESQLESRLESLDRRVLALLEPKPLGKNAISVRLGQKRVSGQLHAVIRALMTQELIAYTLPDKPNSRLQQYRLTAKGRALLKRKK